MRTYSEHVAQVSTALADPTRREIMQYVLDSDGPLSVREVAEYFGLHANAARMHLDKLVKGGLLRVVRRRGKQGGRPANLYSLSDEDWELHLPPRRYKLLAEVLASGVSGVEKAPASRMAREAFARGREEAVLTSSPLVYLTPRAAVEDVADAWLEDIRHRGLKARWKLLDGGGIEMTFHTCPFGAFPQRYPDLVCEIHRCLEEGLLSLAGERKVVAGEARCAFILKPDVK